MVGIVGLVRAALLATAAAFVVVLPSPALAKGPSAKQIQRAAARAERSSSLWATINICSSHGTGKGGELGVRGQMPSLGFPATLRMTVQLGYWSQKHERFMPIPGSSGTSNLSVGSSSTGLEQDGVVFGFDDSAGLLDASVYFSWTRNGKVIAETDRITTAGHRDADYGQPAHFSASSCRLG
jgi:hypothetical protein